VNHSAQPEDCVAVGTTQRGTPVEINRLVCEAELRVATGNIEPHALVGVSGGVKALVPGVASRTTIERNHALSQSYKAQPGDPDNPVHRDLEEAQRLVPVHFLFNTIVNHKREPLAAVAGEVAAAHREGVDIARRLFLVPAEPVYDLVIVSPGGYPKDMQLYQAVKSLRNASAFAKPGGTIVMAARCEEGFGNGTLQYWIETIPDRGTMVSKLKERFVLGAHKIEHIDHLLHNHRICVRTDMPRSQIELTGFFPIDDLQEDLDRLTAGAAPMEIAVMPYGGMTYPYTPKP
jgi:nickel-dependent lactate racemase